MKRLATSILFLVMCLAALGGNTLADTAFDEAFYEENHIWDQGTITLRSIAVAGDAVYGLMTNGDIYRWPPNTGECMRFAQVTALPKFDMEKPFSKQNDNLKKELGKAVFSLIGTEEALYGFNPITGGFGCIQDGGIAWNDVRLDTSILMQRDHSYPLSIEFPFVEGDTLYGFYDMAWQQAGEHPCQAILLSFDLKTGMCTANELPGALRFCRYTPGNLLLMRDNGTKTPVLTRYALANGEQADLDVPLPLEIDRDYYSDWWTFNTQIGGLAYDQASGAIYLADLDGLWIGKEDAPFTRWSPAERWDYLVSNSQAWVLPDGRYVLHNGRVYVFNMADI